MTFTYDPLTDIGKVRRLTGNTEETTSEVTDEEITAWLTDNGDDEEKASVGILRSLAAKYARKATITSGNEKIEYAGVAGNLRSMADALEDSFGTSGFTISAQAVKRV